MFHHYSIMKNSSTALNALYSTCSFLLPLNLGNPDLFPAIVVIFLEDHRVGCFIFKKHLSSYLFICLIIIYCFPSCWNVSYLEVWSLYDFLNQASSVPDYVWLRKALNKHVLILLLFSQ